MNDNGENSSDWDLMYPKEYHEQLLTFHNILIEPLFPVVTEPTINLWKPDFDFDERIPENLEGIPILQGEEIPDNLADLKASIFTDHSYARKLPIPRNSEDHIQKLHHSEGRFGGTKKVHSARTSFKCKFCKRTFRQKSVLCSHIRMCRFRAAGKKPKQKPSTIAQATAQPNANMGRGNDGTEEQPFKKMSI